MNTVLDPVVQPGQSVPGPGEIAGGCRRIQSRWSTDERRRRRRLAQMKRRVLWGLLRGTAIRGTKSDADSTRRQAPSSPACHGVRAISDRARPTAVLDPEPSPHSGPLAG